MDEVKIPIGSTYNPAGSTAAKKAIDDLKLSTDKASGATKEHGGETKKSTDLLDQLGHRGGAAREVIEGLERASNGGTSGLLGMAKAAANMREGLSINPYVLIGGVIIGLLPKIYELGQKFFGAGESAKRSAEDLAAGMAEAAQKGEKLANLKLDGLKRELDEIKTHAAFLAEFSKVLDDLEKRSIDARTNLAIARNKPGKSAPTAEDITDFNLREDAIKQKAAIDDAARAARVAAAEDAAQQSEAIAGKGHAGVADQAKTVTDATARLAEQKRIEEQVRAATFEMITAGAKNPEGMAAAARRQAAGLSQLDRMPSADKLVEEVAGALKALELLVKGLKPLDEAATAAREKATFGTQIADQENTALPGIRANDAAARRNAAGIPEPASPSSGPSRNSTMSAPSIKIGDKTFNDSSLRAYEQSARGMGDAIDKMADHVESVIEINGTIIQRIEQRVQRLEIRESASPSR